MNLQNGVNYSPDYDVIVVGSGPAGCSAAINCRNLGLSVLVVTKQSDNKPVESYYPSESVHPGISSLLNHIGAGSILEKSSVGKYIGIKRGEEIDFFTNDEDEISEGNHINKSIFNKELIELASKVNAHILFNESITEFVKSGNNIVGVITNTNRQIISKYIIDASGRARVSGKVLGLTEYYHSPKLFLCSGKITGIPGDVMFDNKLAMFILKENGWLWLAPEKSNSCTYTSLSIQEQPRIEIPLELERKGVIQKSTRYNMRWRSYKRVAMEGMIICGDAASVIDPAAGQGILGAIYSGIKASETAANCIKNPDKEPEYLDNYSTWFTNEVTKKIEQVKEFYAKKFVAFNNLWAV